MNILKNDVNDNIIEYDDVITLNDLKSKEKIHYHMLDNFFNKLDIENMNVMIKIINGNHMISLRFLDWFVTRYCYLYKLTINIDNAYHKEKNFNINISYKAQLKSFKKKCFDPFRRKKKFYYSNDEKNVVFLTTIGQLNFFKWIITNDIINYTKDNYSTIIEKYNYVNTYFQKNLIENSSYGSSDGNTKSTDTDESTKSNRKTKVITELQVSRDIFLEL